MNILYVSSLEGGKYTGPRYSVPKQITYQSKVDNVYWINFTDMDAHFDENCVSCHCCKLWDVTVDSLQTEFGHIELVIFEEFYKIPNALFAFEVQKKRIPYIIIPRSQMTQQYFLNKKLKKKVAAFALFNRFARKAATVQFLTEREKKDSESYYRGQSVTIPNGIELKGSHDRSYKDGLIGVFIGRYSIVQKGLDIMLEAIKKNCQHLLDNKVSFELYGPDDRTGSREQIQVLVDRLDLGELVHVNGPVFDEEKAEVLRCASFFIHTSRFEGLSMSILEALSYGLPCLVTDGTNIRSEIEKHTAGWGCSTDVNGISRALKEMISGIPKMKEYSKHAVELAKEYSWEEIAEMSHVEYTQIVCSLA